MLRVISVGFVAVALSGCVLGPFPGMSRSEGAQSDQPVASPKATPVHTGVSREKVVNKAAGAMGAKVVGRRGEYLLCSTVDEYRGRSTTYYLCRERACVGQESPALGIKAPKTKSGCLSVCRKQEAASRGKTLSKSYCVN